MKKMTLFSAFVVLAVLAACAQLGLQTPDTFEKKAAAAIVTVQTVAESATAALVAGKLSKTDAENVVSTGRASLQAIMVAQQLYYAACPLRAQIETSDPACKAPAAENKLAATLVILTTLQSYLATQGVK